MAKPYDRPIVHKPKKGKPRKTGIPPGLKYGQLSQTGNGGDEVPMLVQFKVSESFYSWAGLNQSIETPSELPRCLRPK
jgi:hypothetical protein